MSNVTSLLCMVVLVTAGCSNNSRAHDEEIAKALQADVKSQMRSKDANKLQQPKGDPIVVADASSRGEKARKDTKTTDTVSAADGLAWFAFNLYKQLGAESKNLFFAPYSISTVFAMTYAGALGQTASEMASVFGFKLPSARLHSAYAELNAALDTNGQVTLHTANALWASEDFKLKSEYLDVVKRWYHSGIERLDFGDEPKARGQINRWVEDQTHRKIRELIPRGVLDAMTKLVLTNAVYYKGQWALRFDKQNTQSLPFFLSQTKKKPTATMHQTAKLRYAQNQNEKVLELPYRGNQFSFLVILPNEPDGLGKLEKKMSPKYLDTILQSLSQQQVEVYLPAFKMEQSFSLVQSLAQLGLRAAFDKNKADFSGMYTGEHRLHISDVLHKAFLEVNEEGSEAAAATAVVMTYSAAKVEEPKVFRADHPFVFMIRHNPTGSILFMGRLVDPF